MSPTRRARARDWARGSQRRWGSGSRSAWDSQQGTGLQWASGRAAGARSRRPGCARPAGPTRRHPPAPGQLLRPTGRAGACAGVPIAPAAARHCSLTLVDPVRSAVSITRILASRPLARLRRGRKIAPRSVPPGAAADVLHCRRQRMGMLDAVAGRVAGGATVEFRPSGSSMVPLIRSRQQVVVAPVDRSKLAVGDIVLARVTGTVYLHLVSAVDRVGQKQHCGGREPGRRRSAAPQLLGVLSSLPTRSTASAAGSAV